jgi:hypothetical protein
MTARQSAAGSPLRRKKVLPYRQALGVDRLEPLIRSRSEIQPPAEWMLRTIAKGSRSDMLPGNDPKIGRASLST